MERNDRRQNSKLAVKSQRKFSGKSGDRSTGLKTVSRSASVVKQSDRSAEMVELRHYPARCPYYKRCGGCTMINIPYEEQVSRKQSLVEEMIGEFGTVDPIIRMKNPDHYRNKVTSVFAKDKTGHGMGLNYNPGSFGAAGKSSHADGRGVARENGVGRGNGAGRNSGKGQRPNRSVICGIYEKDSHEVVPVVKCLLENTKADAIIQSVLALIPSFKIEPYDEDRGTGTLRYVQVRTAHATHQIMVTLVTSDAIFPSKNNFVTALRKLQPEITTIIQNINGRTDSMILGDREKVMFGPGYIEDRLCGKTFRISSRSFYQVNSIQTEKLYNIAIDDAGLSGKETVLDAYCGIGTIGICASSHAKQVISVELNSDAVRDARENVRLNSCDNVTVYGNDATVFMQELAEAGKKIDVLLMDPPRAGATEDFLRAAVKLFPSKIVYISCAPDTLGRDLGFLSKNGYSMKKATPVDMFPATATSHVETVVLMSRVSNEPRAGRA